MRKVSLHTAIMEGKSINSFEFKSVANAFMTDGHGPNAKLYNLQIIGIFQ